ncbi:MAG TPA: hypothetical protein PK967_04510 [Candidatus Hydrogenedentes bacterium]|nr:hypothetical protein [Candidatus Hydrogenedentota bacterium]
MTCRKTDRQTVGLSWRLVCLLVVSGLSVAGNAAAQGNLMDRVGSVFDGVARGLDFVGRKTQDLLGPGLGFGHGEEGGFVESREFEERYPVASGVHVSVSNAFGGIRVATWDNQVVQIVARIAVRAETTALARELLQGISINVIAAANRIEAETAFPNPRSDMGKLTYEVNYELLVPKDAQVTARNDFGDTHIAGVGGAIVLDVRYGAVELRDIMGRAEVRARGEFPVEVRNLHQGGIFDLHGARAVFRNVAGSLKAANFRGGIELYEVPEGAEADIACESGSITFWIPNDKSPPFSATALFGDVQSDIPLSRVAEQGFVSARSNDAEEPVRIALRTSFGDIAIKKTDSTSGTTSDAVAATTSGQPFKEVLTLAETIPDDGKVIVESMAGDVRIVGADASGLRATATKYVRVQSQPNVRAALQALDVRATRGEGGAISIRTGATDNMAALGCTVYRVDLTIECPRGASLQVQAQDGHTSVEGLGGTVSVVQNAGAVAVEHVKGAISLANRKGDIRVSACAGPVEASASYGEIALKDVYGKTTVEASQARTTIESPHGEIVVRAKGGDVRVLSLDTVPGNYDIRAEQGSIGILLPPGTDAAIAATAENGSVHSGIPLTGSIRKDFQEFVKVGSGPFRITLQTKNGDIAIN